MSELIDLETCLAIRKALIIGLSSFGEIERLDDTWQRHEISNKKLSRELRPIHPTGAADTVGHFAEALAAVDWIESEIRDTERDPPTSG